MKALTGLTLVALSLGLAACNSSEDAAKPSGEPIAAVPAPAGTSWSATVNETPEGNFVMGNPDAKLKLVEYGSFTCSHCADFAETASPEIRERVDTGKMSYEFRTYVRDPIDLTTALLARCGGKDVFYPLSEQFFANQKAMFDKVQGQEGAFKGVEQPPRSASRRHRPDRRPDRLRQAARHFGGPGQAVPGRHRHRRKAGQGRRGSEQPISDSGHAQLPDQRRAGRQCRQLGLA